MTYVSKDAAPFLIMHGDEDRTVPVAQSEVFAEALKKVGADVTLVILKGGKHAGTVHERREHKADRGLLREAPHCPCCQVTIAVRSDATTTRHLYRACMPEPVLADGQEREATPAVVDPVLRSAHRRTLSLDGTWEFATTLQVWAKNKNGLSRTPSCPTRPRSRYRAAGRRREWAGPATARASRRERSIRPLRGSYVGTGWYRKELTLRSRGRQAGLAEDRRRARAGLVLGQRHLPRP